MISTLTAKPDAPWSDRATMRDAALRKRVPDLPNYQVAPWTPEPLLVMDAGAPWIVMPYDKDPLRTADGGYPFPRDVKQRLESLAVSGAEFDTLAIAHELDTEGAVAPLLAKIPPSGLVCDAPTTKTLVGLTPATEVSKRMASTLNRAGDAIGASAPKVLMGMALAPVAVVAAPFMLLAAAAEVMDPIVFGILHVEANAAHPPARQTRLATRRAGARASEVSKGEQLALWYPLAAWKW